MTQDEFAALLERHGLVIAGQSSALAPADGKMYALRDVTGTVESIPLIAASIMSKKLAIGPSHLLLDVKVGAGAFMKTQADARLLAETMARIGEDAGVYTVALLSAMEQPLGRAVGNALEIVETVAHFARRRAGRRDRTVRPRGGDAAGDGWTGEERARGRAARTARRSRTARGWRSCARWSWRKVAIRRR